MIDVEARIAYTERVLGDQANTFFESELGQFVIAKSKDAVDTYSERLLEADPEDSKAIRECQQNIVIAKLALAWINEALNLANQRYARDEVESEMYERAGQ